MARIRTVKPELFKHEELCALSPLHRLVFIGLFCLADREGRLKDRPRSIKLEVAPWDDCDINAILNDLADSPDRFIERYTTRDGERLIQIRAFGKHQAINAREASSTLPARDRHATLTRPAPATTGESTGEVHARDASGTGEVNARGEGRKEGKGKEGRKEEDAHARDPVRPVVRDVAEIIAGHHWLGQTLDPFVIAQELVDAFPKLDVPHHVRLAATGLTPEEVAARAGKAGPGKYLVRYLQNEDRDRVKAERERTKTSAAYDAIPELTPQTFGSGGAR